MNNNHLKHLLLILLLCTLASCTQSNEERLKHINGYWEIAAIENTAGQVKEFGMSQNIDFFEINEDGTGVRKKVQPNALGAFTTSKASENVNVIHQENLLKLQYSTVLDTWEETVKKATDKELILINEDGMIYTYRKYQPLVLE